MQYIMALDQGTTSSRCILFDRRGRVCSTAQKPLRQSFPRPGWVEHDPMEIWAAQMGVAQEALLKTGAGPESVAAIGITNQRETTIVWDRETGRPVCPAIVWQCRRTAPLCQQLLKEGWGEKVRKRCGLVLDAYFSATKLHWILENVPGAREKARRGELLFGTVDTWLIWNLTGGAAHVTDYSNASRTMLFDIHTLKWDAELLERLDIPASMLPQAVPSSQIYGYTKPSIFGRPIPVAGAAGDQQAALFGQGCFRPGMAKNTYGTGCFLLMNTGAQPKESRQGLVTTLAWGLDGGVEYALEGSVFVAGAAIQWLRDELGLIDTAAQSEELAAQVEDTNGCYVVPAFTGLGAPWWNPKARGTVVGLTRGVNRAHLVRATLESLAYQTCDVLGAMERDAGLALSQLRVDGGASANGFLMQFQADLMDAPVLRPACIESTAYGAAGLAGLAVGFWPDREAFAANNPVERVFRPAMGPARREAMLRGWRRAVERARDWAEDSEGNP
ncbi:MAG: glycerol kinase GlpK [Oscillospiraceae bacterium]|nr:glycerol kinase GlpK [Oscillospiraceae bacterium]